jgi:hypothetical protein
MKLTISLWVDVIGGPISDDEAEDISRDIEAILEREIPQFEKVDVVDWNEEV